MHFDVVADAQAGEADHVVGQVEDADRLAHVEHEDFAALPHRAGLDHKLRRLGNQHEVARDVGMRHRDRPAAGNLLAKDRHHAAGGIEHVAEPHRDEPAAREPADRDCTYCSASRLQEPITLVGFTALSVEIITSAFAPCSSARSTRLRVASTMFFTASPQCDSMSGTCLYAAA